MGYSFREVNMKRLQVLMSDERLDELDALVKLTGLKTRTELINYSLTLFEWSVKERLGGRIIASVDEQNERYKEVELPGISLPQSLSNQVLQALRKLVDARDLGKLGSGQNADENWLQALLESGAKAAEPVQQKSRKTDRATALSARRKVNAEK
jgi:hypothetical protein